MFTKAADVNIRLGKDRVSTMKLSLRLPLPALTRTYATRRPEKPPPKIKDPSLSPNTTHYQVAPNVTFIHRAPPTAPTPFSLTTAPSSPLLLPRSLADQPGHASSSSAASSLPPPIKSPSVKTMLRLSEEQIEEMRQLRAVDPLKHTRKKLADQFGCSPFFVPIAAPLTKTEKRKALHRRDQAHEANRSHWGERKKMVVAIRQKRRSLW